MNEHIPFNQPFFAGHEFTYIQNALQQKHASGDGAYTKKCHLFLERVTGAQKALLTTSCTHALEMAALLLHIQPADEVIIPSFTFVSTANAFALRGAKIVFADIRPDTLNIDETKLDRYLTSKTRAVVPVHYGGIGCEMNRITQFAKENQVSVVEDNAHGLFGRYSGKPLGTFGCLGTQSFHETKNFSCGEGGALLINDLELFERAEILREKGTNRSRFFRGLVDKYSWVDLGSSYLPSDILAAFLFAQLERWESIQSTRKKIWDTYREQLSDWADGEGVNLPVVPKECSPSYHLFHLVMPSHAKQTALIQHLKADNINAVFHYQPLHTSEMGKKYGGRKGDCPVTENISESLVRLPFYNALTQNQQDRVIQSIRRFGKRARKAA